LDDVGRVSASPAGDLYRHDADGQLVEWVAPGRRAVTWRYDPGGRLVVEATGSSSSGPLRGSSEVTYEHDALGRLLRRVGPGGTTTTYAYNAAGERVAEESSSGAVTYTWDAAGRLAGIARGSESTEISFDNLGLPAAVGGVEVSWDLSGAWPVVSRIGELSYEREGDSLFAVGPDGSRQAVALDWAGNAEPVDDPWGTSAGSGVRLGYRGELCIGHLVWLGARPYDPATRSFLAPDPLPNPPGAPCAANPYHYAWNDPVSLVDPSGLRPLTQDEFNQRKHAEELGHLGAAWEAIKKDPWGSVALGLTVAAGVGLLFVPGGQAFGAGILIGVALSGGVGVATGTFNPRMVAFNGLVGGFTGGVGSAFSGAGIATQVAVGAGIGAGGSIAQQEVFTGQVDWSQVGISAAVGGAAGGAGAVLGKLAAARSVNAGGVESLPPSSVRFSQTSVNDVTEITDSMRANGWVGDPIDVVRMPDGRFTTVDNTRVLAAHRAGIDVQATVHTFEEPLTGDLARRFTTKMGVPSTWGDAVTYRIAKQSSLYRTTYPMGSPVTGWKGS
jgi:RHS repeat-associated protein